jgi:hypothetical protein
VSPERTTKATAGAPGDGVMLGVGGIVAEPVAVRVWDGVLELE